MKLSNIFNYTIRYYLAGLVLLMISTVSIAQEAEEKQKSWSLNGYTKLMQSVSFSDAGEKWTTDNLIHNRLNLFWYINNTCKFTLQSRNRIYYGETVSLIPEYSSIIDQPMGYLQLSGLVFDEQSAFMHSIIDRANLDITKDKIQITIGRQRINWGKTFVWNPNDLFNNSSFFDFDYEEKPGSDAVRIQYYTSYSSGLDVVVKLNNNEDVTAAALYRFNKFDYDFQFLGGVFNETDYVIGSGFSGALLSGGLRGEVSYFHPTESSMDTSGNVVASIGYDYTFKNSLLLQVEALYNGFGSKNGEFNLNELYSMQMSPKNLSLTPTSFMTQASYPISPLLNSSLSAIYNPKNKSIFFGPSLDYSLQENLGFSIICQYFTSNTSSAMGGRGCFIYWRMKWSF